MAMSQTSTDPNHFNFAKSGSLTSLIIVNKKGTFYVYAMTIIADSSYLKGDYTKTANNTYRTRDKDFTGNVFYNRMDGTFVNGWRYDNGKITGALNIATSGGTGTPVLQSTGSPHVNTAKPM